MSREAEAAAAVGKIVQHRKKGSWYEVVKANREEVYLKAGSNGNYIHDSLWSRRQHSKGQAGWVALPLLVGLALLCGAVSFFCEMQCSRPRVLSEAEKSVPLLFIKNVAVTQLAPDINLYRADPNRFLVPFLERRCSSDIKIGGGAWEKYESASAFGKIHRFKKWVFGESAHGDHVLNIVRRSLSVVDDDELKPLGMKFVQRRKLVRVWLNSDIGPQFFLAGFLGVFNQQIGRNEQRKSEGRKGSGNDNKATSLGDQFFRPARDSRFVAFVFLFLGGFLLMFFCGKNLYYERIRAATLFCIGGLLLVLGAFFI